jgi:hypothetical protein
MLAGLKNSQGSSKCTSKPDTYHAVRQITRSFEEKNTTTVCALLKGETSGVMLRSCEGCVEDACELVEKLLLDKNQV